MRLAILLPASAVIALTARPALPQPRQHVTDPTIKAEVLQLIERYYFRQVTLDTSLSADEIVASLDPHSEYIPPEDVPTVAQHLTRPTFTGFGFRTMRLKGKCVVSSVDPRNCAGRGGLWAGDEIRIVNGMPIGMLTDDALDSMLTEDRLWEFSLLVYRNAWKDTLSIWITRNNGTPVPQLRYFGMIDDTTGYISFSEFSQTIAEQIHYALDLLAERGMTSCILDLRDNYGGLLDEAAKIADIFVGGHTRLFWMRSLHEQFEDTIYATEATPYESLPLTVLVNHNTWSAAEILAGCLQDLDRATIVGEATGGKALVMRHFRLSNGGRVLMTIAGAIMPSGRCTQSLFHNGNYDFGPPDIPNGVNDHSHDEIYTQMPCHRFRTLHGREVSWHEGIIPDIVIAETEEYPDRWYIDAIDTFAVGILRDSSDAYRKMSLAAFMGAPRVAPAIVEKIEKRLEWLDTSAHRSVTTHFAPQLARTVDWRLAARIWDVDASLRYFTCKLPIVRRAWQEPRPQTFTAPAH